MEELNELRAKLHETAEDMVSVLPDPGSWRYTMLYLVELLASKTDDRPGFETMLAGLREDISSGLESGRW